jgi:hypothetical protein
MPRRSGHETRGPPGPPIASARARFGHSNLLPDPRLVSAPARVIRDWLLPPRTVITMNQVGEQITAMEQLGHQSKIGLGLTPPPGFVQYTPTAGSASRPRPEPSCCARSRSGGDGSMMFSGR